MRPICPYCDHQSSDSSDRRNIRPHGQFRRKSDSQKIQRFLCIKCRSTFSRATGHACFGQNKRQINHEVFELLSSGVSQRRIARLLKVNRKTVVRKFLFLGLKAKLLLEQNNRKKLRVTHVQFDDLETFEHTKCKPLSVTIAVEAKSRRILAFQVARMPAKGLLAKIARKKYGFRKDERRRGRRALFKELIPLVEERSHFKSDENPHYPKDLKAFFPHAIHETVKGKRGCITGQGELKKIGFDPLFSLNHTCAMLRANINRLFRKTWCTTKKPERLAAHLAIYAHSHNLNLKPART